MKNKLINKIFTRIFGQYEWNTKHYYQGGRGHWTVNYAGTQSFINEFS